MATKFYKCPHCGNIIVKLVDSGVEPECCGEPMTVLEPQTVDGKEKHHVPVLSCSEGGGIKVVVGEEPHPMTPEHHVCFIAVESAKGIDVHCVESEKVAETTFCCCCDDIQAVYEYCNLHGLWQTTDIPKKQK